jgi:hypothetical protein
MVYIISLIQMPNYNLIIQIKNKKMMVPKYFRPNRN